MKSQTEKVLNSLGTRVKSVEELQAETGILRPNIRRILHTLTKNQQLIRVARGIYRTARALVITGDSLMILPELINCNAKFDMIFLDIPYKTPAVFKTGNRGIDYDTLDPADFFKILKMVKELLVGSNSYLYYMYSTAPSGWKHMKIYNYLLSHAGFRFIAELNYYKYQKNGIDRCRNMRGNIDYPEKIMLLNQSGVYCKMEKELQKEFHLVRPKGYQSQKPDELAEGLIKMSTFPGSSILDPFAGSGVIVSEAEKNGRYAIGIDKNPEAFSKYYYCKTIDQINGQ